MPVPSAPVHVSLECPTEPAFTYAINQRREESHRKQDLNLSVSASFTSNHRSSSIYLDLIHLARCCCNQSNFTQFGSNQYRKTHNPTLHSYPVKIEQNKNSGFFFKEIIFVSQFISKASFGTFGVNFKEEMCVDVASLTWSKFLRHRLLRCASGSST